MGTSSSSLGGILDPDNARVAVIAKTLGAAAQGWDEGEVRDAICTLGDLAAQMTKLYYTLPYDMSAVDSVLAMAALAEIKVHEGTSAFTPHAPNTAKQLAAQLLITLQEENATAKRSGSHLGLLRIMASV